MTTERDELRSAQKKDRENIQKCLERMREFREKDWRISSENQKLQDELQKLTEENQKLQIELSRTQNISQSLQRSNDDLRNRNGLLSRKEQEQLEERIKDVQAWNSKLEKMVVQSSVDAVEEAQKKERAAEKKKRIAENQVKEVKKNTANEIRVITTQMRKEMRIVKSKEKFWMLSFWIMFSLVIIGSLLLI